MPGWLFASLRGYRFQWLPRDLVAGLMLAAIAIPGQLATARLAGMPPETGLYAFAAGSLAFAALRRQSLHVGRGGFDHRADLRRRAVHDRRAGHATLCRAGYAARLLVGIASRWFGLFRAGWLATCFRFR